MLFAGFTLSLIPQALHDAFRLAAAFITLAFYTHIFFHSAYLLLMHFISCNLVQIRIIVRIEVETVQFIKSIIAHLEPQNRPLEQASPFQSSHRVIRLCICFHDVSYCNRQFYSSFSNSLSLPDNTNAVASMTILIISISKVSQEMWVEFLLCPAVFCVVI